MATIRTFLYLFCALALSACSRDEAEIKKQYIQNSIQKCKTMGMNDFGVRLCECQAKKVVENMTLEAMDDEKRVRKFLQDVAAPRCADELAFPRKQ